MESQHDPEHAKRVITLKNVLDSFEAGMHPEEQHTGYYNDLDSIHMGLWAISSAPLMVGSDLTRLSAAPRANRSASCDPDGDLYDKAKQIADTRDLPKTYVSNRLNEMKVRFFGNAAVVQGSSNV